MIVNPTKATPRDLEVHLAFEVDWLVFAAAGHRNQVGRVGVVFQNSALMNARNLLEFTQPLKAPGHGWWICQFDGEEPTESTAYEKWQEFINAKVTHLDERRLHKIEWPIASDPVLRHVELAEFCLDRIETFAPDASNANGKVIRKIVSLGKRYLGGDTSALGELDDLTVR